MSENKVSVAGPSYENYITCPYDPVHRLAPERFAFHLTRCARNFPASKMVRCPFNNTHLFQVDAMHRHVVMCPNRAYFVRYTNPDKLPPAEPPTKPFEIETSEDWDAEPPAPTYDPAKRCREGFVIVTPQGSSLSGRRKFREKERRRFLDNDKF
ncbi:uncharacterized protein Dana_GF10485, isoform A [Drosophila ananassae]|uniref:Uncharacterized protein, isoform A n=1 Tax=Drosophila ananassae TaxID=7217 RepID=B3M428_DROAN|nr:gametocyte-specific factor 1 homolog isoform X1 [Drosophila ananassae]EDV40390.1 uncharacterized protein Dana_GF10485, isoform A [Drosophila ananassae]